jgi:hypothetical protein
VAAKLQGDSGAGPSTSTASAHACFNRLGDMLIVGQARGGAISVLDVATLRFLDVVKVSIGSCMWARLQS